MRWFVKLVRDEKAATAIEYGLICALIFVACIGAVNMVATGTQNILNGVADNVSNSM